MLALEEELVKTGAVADDIVYVTERLGVVLVNTE